MSRKFLPFFRDSSNASDAMLKIRVRLAYPSIGSPKHRCWRSIRHQTWRNLAWSSNLEKLSVVRKAQTPTETPTSTDTTEHKNLENERCFYRKLLITSWKKILTKLLENLWCFYYCK